MTAPNTPSSIIGPSIDVNGTRVPLPPDLRGCGANGMGSGDGLLIRIGHCRTGVANQLVEAILARMGTGQPAEAVIAQAIEEVRGNLTQTPVRGM